MSSCRGMVPLLTQLPLVMLSAPKLRQLRTWVNSGNYSSSPRNTLSLEVRMVLLFSFWRLTWAAIFALVHSSDTFFPEPAVQRAGRELWAPSATTVFPLLFISQSKRRHKHSFLKNLPLARFSSVS